MLTRCPSCDTGFRITSEQIRARQGRVRCGNCQTVFNALETLTEEGAVKVSPPSAPAPATVDELEPQAAEIATGVLPSREGDSLRSDPTFSTGPATTDELPADPLPEPRFVDEPEFTTTTTVDAGIAPNSELHAEQLSPQQTLSEPVLPEQALPETPIDSTTDAHSIVATPPLEPLLHQSLPGETRPRRWPWAVAVVLALLALVLQAAIHFRTELVVLAPETRPVLESLCGLTGCSVDLPRKVELITIEASDLHPEAEPKDALTLTATLRNRAPFAQMYPHLELTLTDTANAALARRILLPEDYLPPATVRDNGLPQGELAITLNIDSGDLGASGYRLYLFYP